MTHLSKTNMTVNMTRIPSIVGRGHFQNAVKSPVEIADIVKTAESRYFTDFLVGSSEQFAAFHDTVFFQVCKRGTAGKFPKRTA